RRAAHLRQARGRRGPGRRRFRRHRAVGAPGRDRRRHHASDRAGTGDRRAAVRRGPGPWRPEREPGRPHLLRWLLVRAAVAGESMRFRSKIFGVLTVVGLLPVALLGWLSFAVNRDELERSAAGAQEALAQQEARGAEHAIARGIEGLRLSLALLPFDQLDAAEIAAALRIPYGQLQFIEALALFDGNGRFLVPVVADPRPGPPRAPVREAPVRLFVR